MKIKYHPPIYGKHTLRVAMEFGVVMSEVAKEKKVKLTPEMITAAEDLLINELKINGLQKTAVNFVPLILAVFEV